MLPLIYSSCVAQPSHPLQGYYNETEDGRRVPVFDGINATLANQV
jgi:hypothetical protein